MYFVILIQDDATPGELHGPMEWNNAVDKCVELSGFEDTPELRERIEELIPVSDDYIRSPYIIQAE